MKPKIYIGLLQSNGKREIFECSFEPTPESHGALYGAVIGPFKTKGAAKLMAQTGSQFGTVAEAERVAHIDRVANRAVKAIQRYQATIPAHQSA